MGSHCLSERVERLRVVYWESAAAYDSVAETLLLRYYERLLPYWPPDVFKVAPDYDPVMLEPFLSQLTDLERGTLTDAMVTANGERGGGWTRVARNLVELILCCAILIDNGRLQIEDDPSVPLLDLFDRGFSLQQDHAQIEVVYRGGMTRIAMPTRTQIEARVSARAASRST